MSENLSHLLGRKGIQNTLFEKLGQLSEQGELLESDTLAQLKKEFLASKGTIAGTTSFYDFLKPGSRDKKIYLCNGSACLTAGTQDGLRREVGKHFSEKEIGEMCCLGRCHENAAFHIGGSNYSGFDIQNLAEIAKGQLHTAEKYVVGHLGTPILTVPTGMVKDFYADLKSFLQTNLDDLLAHLKTSGLRGRGGAGFPMAFKLEACKNEKSETKFLVCNADEGDPGAYSDRYILENWPHLLLKGMMMAAYIMGASWGVVYIRGEYPESVRAVEEAIKELRQQHLLGDQILGSAFSFDFKVIKAQGAYICGEETALLSSIEGQRPEVRVRPPYPTQKGLFNQPTVVNNVETLANLPFIFANGGKAFASIGTQKSTGTKLVSLDGFFNRPGIYEVDMGTPLATVVHQLGGGFRQPVKAMQIGGPLGGIVPTEKIESLSIDFESFAQGGFLLGHASVVCIPVDFPIMDYLIHLFRFTAHESCGKCFPCRLGSTRGAELLEKASSGGYTIDKNLMTDLLETMESGSLCALGGGLPLPIKNALHYFEAELSPYFSL